MHIDVDKLERFFSEFELARPFGKPTSEPAKAAVYPYSDALSKFLTKLREPLERTRASGELLNVWWLAGVGRDELTNTELLGWLLDCNGSHSRGNRVWESILKRIARDLPTGFPFGPHLVKNYITRLEPYPLGNTESRIDIELEGDTFLIFVEAKIEATYDRDQIDRYLKLLSHKADNRQYFLLFISSSPPDEIPPDKVVIVTWRDIAKTINDLIRNEEANFVSILFKQLSRHYASL